jgi:hypothetical protein
MIPGVTHHDLADGHADHLKVKLIIIYTYYHTAIVSP